MLKKLIKIISSKKDFLPPRKTNILVIDDNFKKIVDVYFNKKKVSFLDIRYKRFNIFVLLKLFFSKKKIYFLIMLLSIFITQIVGILLHLMTIFLGFIS